MMSQERSDKVRTHNSGLLRSGLLLIAALAGSAAHARTCPAGLVPVAPDARYTIAEPIAGQSVWLQTPWGGWTRVALPGPAYTFAASAPPALGQPSNTNTAGPTQEEYEAAQRLAAAAFAA